MKKNIVVIVAGGKGTRMNSEISKQFMLINGKPIITYTIAAFDRHREVHEIILVLPENELEYYRNNIMNKYPFKKLKALVKGGGTRQESVYNGLVAAEACEVVLIHDGVRPFVSEGIITEGIAKAKSYGAAACGVTPKDTIKIKAENGFSLETPDRSKLFAVQTPQCFLFPIIKEAHEKIKEDNIAVTDDTMAVEAIGKKVYLYEGSYDNIKITTAEDIIIAESILRAELS
ncbi:2-C-methyl-D-erythritol 4-phosphate cytidylyltransferase [Alloiococcus sp. CFN-8]|uniref:2-C-methyl-D-erythritol 4-phosphate cytidylyltransferase n=1 Tax=Alloiococcus sp. CFN-8 TaxID=3416081 RepID=UPI003CF4841C